MDIAQLGIRVDSNTTKTAATDLDKMTAAAGRADVAVDRVGTAHGKMAAGASRASFQSRMVAQQLSQVAQQSMVTGNFVQALAIQLPDMALGFGAVGIAAGVVAGVALPLLASAFGGVSNQSKAAATALEALDEAVKRSNTAITAAQAPATDLAAVYGNLALQAKEALDAQAAAANADAIVAANTAIAESLAILGQSQQDFLNGVAQNQNAIFALASEYSLTQAQATALMGALDGLARAEGLSAQSTAATEVRRQLEAVYPIIANMPKPIRDTYDAMNATALKTADLAAKGISAKEAIAGAAAAAGQLPSLIDMAAARAGGLAGALANAAAKAWDIASGMAAAAQASADQRLKDFPIVSAYQQYGRTRSQAPKDPVYHPPENVGGSSGGGGGGGGGAPDDFATRLAALQTEHESEVAQANKWYTDAQTVLADRRSIEVLGVQGHKDKLLEIEKIHQQQMAAIAANAQASRLSQTAGLFGALASIAEAGGKKSAKAVATFQAIEGTINAYGAAIKALNTPGITLAGRFAAYASVLGAGLKGVAAIRSAGGVSGGGGGGAPAAQAIAPQAQETRLVVQGIKLTDILTGQMLMDILQKEFGARNVAFLR